MAGAVVKDLSTSRRHCAAFAKKATLLFVVALVSVTHARNISNPVVLSSDEPQFLGTCRVEWTGSEENDNHNTTQIQSNVCAAIYAAVPSQKGIHVAISLQRFSTTIDTTVVPSLRHQVQTNAEAVGTTVSENTVYVEERPQKAVDQASTWCFLGMSDSEQVCRTVDLILVCTSVAMLVSVIVNVVMCCKYCSLRKMSKPFTASGAHSSEDASANNDSDVIATATTPFARVAHQEADQHAWHRDSVSSEDCSDSSLAAAQKDEEDIVLANTAIENPENKIDFCECIYKPGGKLKRVYRAILQNHFEVAIKLVVSQHRVTPGASQSEKATFVAAAFSTARNDVEDLMREAVVLSKLYHPNVIRTYGVVTWIVAPDGCQGFGVATEFCSHGSLKSVLSNQKITLSLAMRLRLARGIVAGMRYLHDKRILHRDLKSSNLLIDEHWNIKVNDFGNYRASDIHSTALPKVDGPRQRHRRLLKSKRRQIETNQIGVAEVENHSGNNNFTARRPTRQEHVGTASCRDLGADQDNHCIHHLWTDDRKRRRHRYPGDQVRLAYSSSKNKSDAAVKDMLAWQTGMASWRDSNKTISFVASKRQQRPATVNNNESLSVVTPDVKDQPRNGPQVLRSAPGAMEDSYVSYTTPTPEKQTDSSLHRTNLSSTKISCPAQHVQSSASDTPFVGHMLTTMMGTLQYLAPELFSDQGYYTYDSYEAMLSSDVYSFGVVLWEIFTRASPWFDESLRGKFAIKQKVVTEKLRPSWDAVPYWIQMRTTTGNTNNNHTESYTDRKSSIKQCDPDVQVPSETKECDNPSSNCIDLLNSHNSLSSSSDDVHALGVAKISRAAVVKTNAGNLQAQKPAQLCKSENVGHSSMVVAGRAARWRDRSSAARVGSHMFHAQLRELTDSCWHNNPNARASFTEIHQKLENLTSIFTDDATGGRPSREAYRANRNSRNLQAPHKVPVVSGSPRSRTRRSSGANRHGPQLRSKMQETSPSSNASTGGFAAIGSQSISKTAVSTIPNQSIEPIGTQLKENIHRLVDTVDENVTPVPLGSSRCDTGMPQNTSDVTTSSSASQWTHRTSFDADDDDSDVPNVSRTKFRRAPRVTLSPRLHTDLQSTSQSTQTLKAAVGFSAVVGTSMETAIPPRSNVRALHPISGKHCDGRVVGVNADGTYRVRLFGMARTASAGMTADGERAAFERPYYASQLPRSSIIAVLEQSSNGK